MHEGQISARGVAWVRLGRARPWIVTRRTSIAEPSPEAPCSIERRVLKAWIPPLMQSYVVETNNARSHTRCSSNLFSSEAKVVSVCMLLPHLAHMMQLPSAPDVRLPCAFRSPRLAWSSQRHVGRLESRPRSAPAKGILLMAPPLPQHMVCLPAGHVHQLSLD